jgi:flagellar protein FlgJ
MMPTQRSLSQKTPEDHQMRDTAKKFEGMFLANMLETMFDQIPEDETMGESSMFKSFWIQSLAEKMSETGIGLADVIYKQMKQASEGKKHISSKPLPLKKNTLFYTLFNPKEKQKSLGESYA